MSDENRNIAEKWAEIYGKKEIERLKADLLTVAESKASIRAGGMERAAVIVEKWKDGREPFVNDKVFDRIAFDIRKEIK